MFNNLFKPALAWSFDHFSFCDNPHNLTTSSFCSHNLANPSLFIASYPIMPFPSPAIITQDEVDCLTMTSSNESSQANSVDNKPQVPPISRKLAQRDLHGNPVPASNSRSKWSHTGSGTVHRWKSILARLLASLLPNHPTRRSCSRLFSSPKTNWSCGETYKVLIWWHRLSHETYAPTFVVHD